MNPLLPCWLANQILSLDRELLSWQNCILYILCLSKKPASLTKFKKLGSLKMKNLRFHTLVIYMNALCNFHATTRQTRQQIKNINF